MKKTHVFCDKCQQEVEYYLLPRYNLDNALKEIVRRRIINIEHLCEKCMEDLVSSIGSAIDKWSSTIKDNINE